MVILRLCFSLCYRPVLFISLSFCLLSFIFALSFLQLFHAEVENLCAKTGRCLKAKRAWSNKFCWGLLPKIPVLHPCPRGRGPSTFFRLDPPLVFACTATGNMYSSTTYFMLGSSTTKTAPSLVSSDGVGG